MASFHTSSDTFQHGQRAKTAVLLVNLGTPDEPTAPALRRYLAQFLSDPRVVELPKWLWNIILHGIILRVRPARSARKYASIWLPDGSPLKVWTQKQTAALQRSLGGQDVTVAYAMRYGNPGIHTVMSDLQSQGVTRVLVLPLYPQYCGATTASVVDEVSRWLQHTRWIPEVRFITSFFRTPGYLDALAQQVKAHWAQHGKTEKLVLSFHGVPVKTLHQGDPYHCECLATARLLAERLGLSQDELVVTFQSRFGKAQWLQPYTEPTLVALAEQGVRSVTVMCPGFVSDCVETLEEICLEVQAAFKAHGGQTFHYIPCLNDDPAWINTLTELTQQHMAGWPLTDSRSEAERTRQRQIAAQCPHNQSNSTSQASA